MTVRQWAVGAMAAGLMVSLGACSDDAKSASTSDAALAPTKVAALSQAGFGEAVIEAQEQAKSVHIESTIKAAGQTVTMSGDVTGLSDVKTLAMSMAVDAMNKNIEVRLVDQVLYVRGLGVDADKPWVKLDLTESNPMSSFLDSAGPQSFLSYLKAVSKIRDEGTEVVDGVETRHYTVTINTAKALAANPAMKGHGAISKLGLPAKLKADAWLNADNLPVKMAVKLGDVASFEAHFSDYGKRVVVKAPPARSVGTFGSIPG
jgi:hypothetical protein